MMTEFLIYAVLISALLVGCGTFDSREMDKVTGLDVYTSCEGDCKCISKITGKGTERDRGHTVTVDQVTNPATTTP